MARSDAQKRARAKYEKEKVKQVMVRFYPPENDILEFLESQFWSSGILTGNQTDIASEIARLVFWSSGILTGNQTEYLTKRMIAGFWSSGILTGNQTCLTAPAASARFGAVAF